MSELPRSIQIGPLPYSVDGTPEGMMRVKADEASAYVTGYIDYRKLVITVDTQLPFPRTAEALMHEVLHGVLHCAGVNWLIREDEHFVEMVAPMLLDTLRRNPDLVTYLTKGNSPQAND